MRIRTAVGALLGFAVGVALVLAPARASDTGTPRTPTLWPEATCMTIVDRSVDPVVQLGYAIPFEDTMLTMDEVPTGRTHQFFAFRRDVYPEELLPNWITAADVAEAEAAGKEDPDGAPDEHDILEQSPAWNDPVRWVRITGDDERRPIDEVNAAMPVPWDTSGLETGQWVVTGYTWHPFPNLWSPRPGAFKVVDGPDDPAPPAVAVMGVELPGGVDMLPLGETATIVGCVDALDGSTVRGYWAEGGSWENARWTLFAEEPAPTGPLALSFTPTAVLENSNAMIRVEVEDPQGRVQQAHFNGWIAVGPPDEECPPFSPECEGESDETGEDETTGDDATNGDEAETSDASSEDSDNPPADDGGDPEGCNCATGSPPQPGSGLALLAALLLRRRRRLC